MPKELPEHWKEARDAFNHVYKIMPEYISPEEKDEIKSACRRIFIRLMNKTLGSLQVNQDVPPSPECDTMMSLSLGLVGGVSEELMRMHILLRTLDYRMRHSLGDAVTTPPADDEDPM